MPPARRGRPPGSSSASHHNPRSNAQSTLAFGRNNKITKPSFPPASSRKASKPTSAVQSKDINEVVEATAPAPAKEQEDEGGKDEVVNEDPTLAEGRERQREKEMVMRGKEEKGRDEAEERARRVSEAAVKRYWREKEGERKAPRVHQQTLTLHEKILRHFDLSSQYGPCVGISRTRRWKRAEGLALGPPIEVLAVLLKEQDQGKGMERAFMDGLLGGSAVVGS
ncbi:MAG: hypothetical protein Q9181_006457 [Wetmoreana brouardii]